MERHGRARRGRGNLHANVLLVLLGVVQDLLLHLPPYSFLRVLALLTESFPRVETSVQTRGKGEFKEQVLESGNARNRARVPIQSLHLHARTLFLVLFI
jgi:hypothetical protein